MFIRHLLPAVLLSWAMQPIALAQEVDLPGWELVWRDEFDSSSLDMSKWEAVTLNSTYPGDVHYYLPEHASVVDGKLRITATDEPIEDKLYRSARLESWQAFGPGRFEARIDLPTGQGMAPAFWLYPNDPAIPWPTGGGQPTRSAVDAKSRPLQIARRPSGGRMVQPLQVRSTSS